MTFISRFLIDIIANRINIIINVDMTTYIYGRLGYKVLPLISILANETHVIGEYLVEPVQVM